MTWQRGNAERERTEVAALEREAERQVKKALDILERHVKYLPRVKRTVLSQQRASALLNELRFVALGPEGTE